MILKLRLMSIHCNWCAMYGYGPNTEDVAIVRITQVDFIGFYGPIKQDVGRVRGCAPIAKVVFSLCPYYKVL